jgi:ribulose-phosphate 3-epimerase
MSVITPTITTDDSHAYREQMEIINTYSEGVHIDFSDGIFSPSQLLPIDQAWRLDDLITHAHIMYQKPLVVMNDIIDLQADLVILHIESDDIKKCLQSLEENGTRAGIALLPESTLADIQELSIDGLFDHILVFGGHLGSQGGIADLEQLDKVKILKNAYPDAEIAWDGGVSADNAKQIAKAGVDVLNVGGYLKSAEDPEKTYDQLVSLLS